MFFMKKVLSLALLFMASLSFGQIVNGTFSSSTGFTTDYPLSSSCPPTSEYHHCVSSTGWNGDTDHSTPSDMMLVVDGIDHSPEPNTLIWGQTVGVSTFTTYAFSCWIDPRNYGGNVIDVDVLVDGVVIDNIYITSGAGTWQHFISNTFTTGASSSISLELRQNTTTGPGTDFNLDDLSLLTEGPCGLIADFSFVKDASDCGKWNFTAYTSDSTAVNAYLWDFGGGIQSLDQNPSVYLGDGTHTVCLTIFTFDDEGNCCSQQICKTVTITNSCNNVTVELYPCDGFEDFEFEFYNEDPSFPCTYQFMVGNIVGDGLLGYFWDFGDGATSDEQYPIHTYTADGTYTVCITIYFISAEGQCCSIKSCKEITVEGCEKEPGEDGKESVSGSGIGNVLSADVFPNPVKEMLNISISNPAEEGTAKIVIMNNAGQLMSGVSNEVKIGAGVNQLQIDTKEMASGVYIINIEVDGKMMSKKFVKE